MFKDFQLFGCICFLKICSFLLYHLFVDNYLLSIFQASWFLTGETSQKLLGELKMYLQLRDKSSPKNVICLSFFFSFHSVCSPFLLSSNAVVPSYLGVL